MSANYSDTGKVNIYTSVVDWKETTAKMLAPMDL